MNLANIIDGLEDYKVLAFYVLLTIQPQWKWLDCSIPQILYHHYHEGVWNYDINSYLDRISKCCPQMEKIRLAVSERTSSNAISFGPRIYSKEAGVWKQTGYGNSQDWIIDDIPWYLR